MSRMNLVSLRTIFQPNEQALGISVSKDTGIYGLGGFQ